MLRCSHRASLVFLLSNLFFHFQVWTVMGHSLLHVQRLLVSRHISFRAHSGKLLPTQPTHPTESEFDFLPLSNPST